MRLGFSQLKTSELGQVNELIEESKAHWYADAGYLRDSLEFIRIDEAWMQDNRGWSLYEDDELVGFLGYSKFEDYWYLEHLWIVPEKIGMKYGSQALTFLLNQAKKSSIGKISLLPEPKAEDFYSKFGAVYSGLEVPSLHQGGPVFKEMVIHI